MSFLAPLFLIGAIAGVIPIVLHMINRRRAKELPFPTLRFLRISVEQTRRRKRIHNLLLLILRIAALVFLALALAKPALTNLSQLWSDRAQTAMVIVLDNSATMGTSDGTVTRWEKARDATADILRQLNDGDAVALLLTGGRPFTSTGKFDRTQETVRQMVAEATLSHEKADLSAALSHARQMLSKIEAANKSIFLITDRQAASWGEVGDSESATTGRGSLDNAAVNEKKTNKEPPAVQTGAPENSLDTSVPVVVVDCRSEATAPNVAISDVQAATTVPIARFPFIVTVELFNTSSTTAQRHVELYLDGNRYETSPAIEIPPGERVKFPFTLKVSEGGEHRGRVQLTGNDASKLDDQRFFAVSVDRDIPVAIVQDQPHEIDYLDDTFYLATALGARKESTDAGSLGIRPVKIKLSDLAAEPLGEYRAVFCVNLPAPDDQTSRHLADYVAGGGNLVWIAGNHVDPEAYNQMNDAVGGRLLPGLITGVNHAELDPDRDSWHISQFNEEAPTTSDFAKYPALFQSVLVYHYLGITAEDAIALARLDNGDVLLSQRDMDEGRVWWLGTNVHIDWTNFPLRPIFMPFWVRLVHGISSSTDLPSSVIAGHPLRVPLEGNAMTDRIELRPPSGELLRLAVETPQQDQTLPTFEYDDTYQIGVYTLTPVGASEEERRIFCVNLDQAELEDTPLDRDALAKQVGDAPFIFVSANDSPSETFALLRSGVGLWQFFLMSVLVVLVFETYWSNRRKGDAS